MERCSGEDPEVCTNVPRSRSCDLAHVGAVSQRVGGMQARPPTPNLWKHTPIFLDFSADTLQVGSTPIGRSEFYNTKGYSAVAGARP